MDWYVTRVDSPSRGLAWIRPQTVLAFRSPDADLPPLSVDEFGKRHPGDIDRYAGVRDAGSPFAVRWRLLGDDRSAPGQGESDHEWIGAVSNTTFVVEHVADVVRAHGVLNTFNGRILAGAVAELVNAVLEKTAAVVPADACPGINPPTPHR